MKIITGKRKEVYTGIRQYVNKFKKHIIILFTFKFFLIFLGILSPLFFKLLVDNVMIKKQLDILKWVVIGYISIYFLETLVLFSQRKTSNKVFNKVSFDIRLKLWRTFTRMPFISLEKHNSGDLKNRIDSDVDTLENFINQQLIEYLYNWGVVLATGIVLTIVNWKLAMFGFLMVPVSFWMTKFLGKGVKKASEDYRNTWGKYENWLQGSIQGWKEVKALTIEKNENRVFTRYWHDLCNKFFKRQVYWYGNRSFIALKDFFITRMNLYFIGGLLIFSGELTIGSLLVFMKYYEQFFGGVGKINDLDMQIRNDTPSIERVLEMIKIPNDIKTEKTKNIKLNGNIEFYNVSFRYNEAQKNIFSNLKFKIKSKERIAIVGKSGCGKTTLIKLILGLYSPQRGNIFIDGYDISKLHSSSLNKNVGVVMQDSILFNLSIRDNLLLAKPSATEEEIKRACKMAYIDEFIDSLTDKYMTIIGEKGVKLSGGQKQRLAIARLFLSNPSIIIFDEATSSLDHESEKMINKAIDNISKDKTLIIIAHRLSSIKSADRIIALDNGKIIDDSKLDSNVCQSLV